MSEQGSQDRTDKLRGQVWRHLELGQWHSAALLAERMTEIDPLSGLSGLAEATRALAMVSEAIRLNEPIDPHVGVRLEEMGRTWPRLAAMRSFQALTKAVEEASAKAHEAQTAMPDAAAQGTSPRAAASSISRPGRSIVRRVLRPEGCAGIGATIACILAVLVVFNSVAFYYLREQPRSSDGPEAVPGAQATLPHWHGLMEFEGPVDTIILGDSTAGVNLVTGPVADRLGGSAINLGNNSYSSLLMDAWMLQYYIDKFGPPRNVIVSRSCNSYEREHNLEFMSVVPLEWAYWDRLGVAPAWTSGEQAALFMSMYGVLTSRSDILAYRLTHPLDLLSQPYARNTPAPYYFMGITTASEFGNFTREKQPSFFGPFNPSSDSENALTAMSEQARELGFQLYFVLAPEWDGAYQDPDRQAKVDGMVEWLDQFTDAQYVHVCPSTPMTFQEDQMQSPNHLRPGPERRYTEMVVAEVVAIQSRLTSGGAVPLHVSSVDLDKDRYAVGDQPSVTLTLTSDAATGTDASAMGSVSCLVRWGGKTDGYWVYRAPATAFSLASGGTAEVTLTPTVGGLALAGGYDLVVFVRQDVGGLCSETRIEIPWTVKVS